MVKKRIINRVNQGFTLIELLVVLAIIAMLVSMASPRFFRGLEKAKETALKHDLVTMRESIGQFYADQNRYPQNLDELVQTGYLKAIPVDPISESLTSWVLVGPPLGSGQSGVFDVLSGAAGQGSNGISFANY